MHHEMWLWSLGMALVWWLVASVLVYYTWNRVVTKVINVRPVGFWGAFLFVATLAVLCGPSKMHHKQWQMHEKMGEEMQMDD